MTSNKVFTPITGVNRLDPLCYILEIDDFKIMLDCGWDARFSLDDIAPLTKLQLVDINAVLITHPDLSHLGALPYAFAKLGLDCPVYATLPVWKMGHLFLYDAFQSIAESSTEFKLFTLDDIDHVFLNKFVRLKPMQDLQLSTDLLLTPYTAGHMIGGAVWKISKDTEQIVYAVDYNHCIERHLSPSQLLTFERPTLLITDAYNIGKAFAKRNQRDKLLMKTTMAKLRKTGNVLIPTDTGGRCLELLMLFYSFWKKQKYFQHYTLAFLSYTSGHVMDAAKTFLEWMNQNIRDEIDNKRRNPFSMPELAVCRSIDDLTNFQRGARQPMVVLASNEILEGGFSEALFEQWHKEPNNAIILTSEAPKGTLAYKLANLGEDRTVTYTKRWKTPMKGKELEEFLARPRSPSRERDEFEDEDMDSVDEEDVPENNFQDQIYDTLKQRVIKMVPQFPMFPFTETHIVVGAYGEDIDHKMFESKDVVVQPSNWLPESDAKASSKNDLVQRNEDVDPMKNEATPMKSMSEERTAKIECDILYIDMEGRSDGKSVTQIIKKLNPRRMVVVHGDPEQKKELKEFCSQVGLCRDVKVVADPMKEIRINTDTTLHNLVLSQQLNGLLKFVDVMEYQLSYCEAKIRIPEHEEQIHQGSVAVAGGPKRWYLEPPISKKSKGHRALYLGDVKLLEIKLALDNAGHPTILGDGVLCCGKDHPVFIERKGVTKLAMKGVLCDEYYEIRDILVKQFNVL